MAPCPSLKGVRVTIPSLYLQVLILLLTYGHNSPSRPWVRQSGIWSPFASSPLQALDSKDAACETGSQAAVAGVDSLGRVAIHPDEAFAFQVQDDFLPRVFRRKSGGVDPHFGVGRLLVRI